MQATHEKDSFRNQRVVEKTQLASPAQDLSALLGCWVNTNTPVNGFRHLELTAEGCLVELQACGATAPLEGDWGRVRADAVYASDVRAPRASAFTARYDLGFAECLVQANQSLGLLIVAQLFRFTDGSGRQNYFTREFYRRAAEASVTRTAPVPRASVLPAALERSGTTARARALDSRTFVGVWQNTQPATTGMSRLEVNDREGMLFVRIHGAGESLPHDWGEAPVDGFAASLDSSNLASFVTRRDLGIVETHFHTWVKQGVLVAARFDRFKDGRDCPNRFSREFFYRIDPAEARA